MNKTFLITGVLFVVLMVASPVLADEVNPKDLPWEKFNISFGGFRTALDSNVRVGSEKIGAGVEIDVEDALGLESTTSVFRLEAKYRAGKSQRHKLELSWMGIYRKSTKKIDEEIEIGDKVFPVNTRIDSRLDIDIIKTGYSYSLLFDDRFDLGIGLGVFIMPITVSLEANKEGKEEVSLTAPLPTINISGNFALTKKLFLRERIDFFWLEYENFKGVLTNVVLALEYKLFKHVGIGVGYDTFRLNLEANGEDYPEIDFRGDFEFKYVGLMLYGMVYF